MAVSGNLLKNKSLIYGTYLVSEDLEGGIGSSLPPPNLKSSIAEFQDYAYIFTTTSYDQVPGTTLHIRRNEAPNIVDPVLDGNYKVDQNGFYYVKAFPPQEGSTYRESNASIISIDILKVQNPVIVRQLNNVVEIDCATEGASIRYTLDNSDPTEESNIYAGPFTVPEGQAINIRARAFKSNVLPSEIVQLISEETHIFGVRWKYSEPSSTLTRLTPETDPYGYVTDTISTEPQPEIQGSQVGSSPFDEYAPWSGIKRRNFGDDGTGQFVPGDWEGDPGFTVTGKDTMVYIPKFYVKQIDDQINSLRYYYISNNPVSDFELHPGSDQYVACYIPTVTDDLAISKSGVTKATATIDNHRIYARNKGYGWQLFDFAELQAIQFIYLIEFADWDSSNKIGLATITDMTTGGTDALTYHTGKLSNGRNRYRWIEDPYGFGQYYFDGLLTIGGTHNICLNRENYNSTSSIGYESISDVNINGYVTKTLYDENRQWIIGFPAEANGGSSTTYLCDNCVLPTNTTAVYTVGYNEEAGLFHINNNSGNLFARLSWKKAKASKPVFTITYTAGGTT